MVAACLIWRIKDNKWLGKVPNPSIEEVGRVDMLSSFKEVRLTLILMCKERRCSAQIPESRISGDT